MFRKILILALVFYFLVLGQTSFLIHFKVVGTIPFVLILILVILLNFLAPHQNWWGVASAFIAGFFLDIFSSGIIGFYALTFSFGAILIKTILKNYVWAVR